MDQKKLNSAGLRIWLELNSQLEEIGGRQLFSYLYIIYLLLDCTLRDFSEGDNQEFINEYEHVLEYLKDYVHHLKEKYEN